MRKRMVRISSFSILLGLAAALIQTGLIYFLEDAWFILPILVIVDLVFCQYLLESSFSFPLCFRYLLTMEFLTLLVAIPSRLGMFGTLLSYSPVMAGLVIVHLLAPALFCTVRYLADFGPRFMNFKSFFLGFSVVLCLMAAAGFIYCYVVQPGMFPGSGSRINLIPFYTISAHIEAKIQDGTSLKPAVLYLLTYGTFFLPVGFYLHLALGRLFLLRYASFVLLPAVIELAQYFFRPSQCNMDDAIIALFGCLIGSALYGLLNRICLSLHEEEFLKKRSRTSLYL